MKQFLKIAEKATSATVGLSNHVIAAGIWREGGLELPYKNSTVKAEFDKKVEGPTHEKIGNIDIIYCTASTQMGHKFTFEILGGPQELIGQQLVSEALSSAKDTRAKGRENLIKMVENYIATKACAGGAGTFQAPSENTNLNPFKKAFPACKNNYIVINQAALGDKAEEINKILNSYTQIPGLVANFETDKYGRLIQMSFSLGKEGSFQDMKNSLKEKLVKEEPNREFTPNPEFSSTRKFA